MWTRSSTLLGLSSGYHRSYLSGVVVARRSLHSTVCFRQVTSATATATASSEAIRSESTNQPPAPTAVVDRAAFGFPNQSTRSNVKYLKEARIPLPDAVHLVKCCSVGYPDLDVAVHLQCKKDDASVRDLRGTSVLPHNFMKTKTLVFASGQAAEDAKNAGADIVGGEELVAMIQSEELEFDRVIATPEMMAHVNKLARTLGPRGLMPTVKKGTVTEDVVAAMQQQACAVLFKADVNGFLSAVVGKTLLSRSQLEENIRKFVDDIKASKKGKQTRFVENMAIQAKQGPMIQLSRSEWNI